VGDSITQHNLPTDISKPRKLPIFVTQFEWAFQLPDLKSPNCQNYLIFVTQFEWAFQLPDLICHMKSPDCENYLIFVTQFEWAIQLLS